MFTFQRQEIRYKYLYKTINTLLVLFMASVGNEANLVEKIGNSTYSSEKQIHYECVDINMAEIGHHIH